MEDNNLLKETNEFLTLHNLDSKDIIFIGFIETGKNVAERCSWAEFESLADITYDGGYGMPGIKEALIIIFNDGTRMYRHIYDGSEWWEIIEPFVMPKDPKPIKFLNNFV